MRLILAVFPLIALLVVVGLPSLVSTGAMRGNGALLPPVNGDAVGAIQSLGRLIDNLIVLAAALTNYTEGQLIKHLYRTGSFTKPTVMAHGLYTATPGEAGGGTEVSGGSYARVDLPPLDANWRDVSAGDGTTNNLSAITFPAPTGNWGVVTSLAQIDATTSGNMLTYGALTASKTINNGDSAPSFGVAALSFQIDS